MANPDRSFKNNGGMLRALQVIPGEPGGSTFVFAKRQAVSLQKAGVEVKTFFLASRTSPVLLFKEWLRLRSEIRNFKPHLIHSQYGTITAFLCAFGTSLPLVVTFWGSDLNPVPSINRLRALIGRVFSNLAALRAAHIICVTRQLKDRLWWGRNRATVIPGGVNLNVFHPRCKDEARFALGWTHADPTILFNAGKFPEVKRLDLAEAAAEAAKSFCANIRLVVLRGGVDPEAVPLFLNAADCLLVTSDWEGSPNIVKEALACNLPVVSVDVGDVAERLEKVTPSRIVRRDPHQLGAALAEVLSFKCRSNGREMIQEFSEEREAERIRIIYEGVTRRGDCRPLNLSTSVAPHISESARPPHKW